MVCGSLDVVCLQYGCQFLYLLSRQTVDDAALSRMLAYELDDILVHILRLRPYFIIKVGAIERALELLGIDDAEVFLYVGTHLVGGCRRERDDRRIAYLIYDGSDASVFWTEVMSPLRDTVSLIDSIK